MPTSEQFLAAAHDAAASFGLDPIAITELSHSENVVFDVALSHDEHVVMRLHRPGYNSLAEMECEVAWVQALAEAGLPVPGAIRTPHGSHYTSVDVGGETRHVGVVSWVEGEPLGGPIGDNGAAIVPYYRQIGAVAARIHLHSEAWHRPEGFARRRWDGDGLVGERPLWGPFWEAEHLTSEQQELFVACRDALRIELASVPTTSDRFGLIHADLHLGNLMSDGTDLTVIDFDDAGFGWFAHELAVALHPVYGEPWDADARAALLDGYRTERALGAEDERLIDTFLTMRCLMLIGWLDVRRELPTYQHFPELAAEAVAAAHDYLGR